MAFNALQIQEFRKETDGTKHVIHLNNAGASLPPNVVRDEVVNYLNEEALLGGYELNRKYAHELAQTYDELSKLIGAAPSEIALVENATVAWRSAFYAVNWKEGDEVICNVSDYASNYLSYLHHPAKPVIKVLPNNVNGDERVDLLADMITEKTKLVSITHMPTNSGHVAPVESIGKVCKEKGVLFLLDACQSLGQYPIDVSKIQCDMLSATGRKYLRGPRGTGFLYVSRKVLDKVDPIMIDLHAAEWTGEYSYSIRNDARKFENWEGNRANQMGLKTAAAYASSVGLTMIWEQVQNLADYTRESFAQLGHVHCHDQGSGLSGIVSFTVDKHPAAELVQKLWEQGINLSWNGRSNTYLDMTAKRIEEIVRCSVHYYNTKEEIDQLVNALKKMK